MRFPRAAGILLHPTSLPGRYGIGDFGQAAYDFVDFLSAAKQSYWQTLPLGPTGYGDSPYQCFSAFAGNALLINPDLLVRDGFLPPEAIAKLPAFPAHEVDYGNVIPFKMHLLQLAHRNFLEQGSGEQMVEFQEFCDAQSAWLDDYALFMALKTHHIAHAGGVWSTWPAEIAHRQPEALARWNARLAGEVALHKFVQFLFFRQWLALKRYANEQGIQIIGDIPIFVAYDSADVWANPELFFLDDVGQPTVIAGVPPDYFSETGQRWGNPLYRWQKMAANNFRWWRTRLEMCFTQADIIRIDHFRGFQAYWEIPASELTAVKGRWVKGPGAPFFEAMQEQLGVLPLIAEDLGVITPEVETLRDQFDFPGMKILQFAFGGERNSSFLPHNYNFNCFVYPGTHDNETTLGWYRNANSNDKDHIRLYMGVDGHDITWDMIRLAWMSVADTAVIPLQDVLSLDNQARMNFPGKVGGYWRWRFEPEMLQDWMAERLRDLTDIYGRFPADIKLPTPQYIAISDD